MEDNVPSIPRKMMIGGILLTGLLTAAATCPGPAGSITATTKRNQLGGEITIKGTGFEPGHTIRFKYQGIPDFVGAFSPGIFVNVDGTGSFQITDTSVRCTTRDTTIERPNVLIIAEDSTAPPPENPVTTVSPSIWICP
jgi:hypothetical protein